MKALVKSRPARGLDLLEVPDPVPGTGEVLIRVEAAGVCGSDVARYVWTRNYEAGAAKAMTDDLPRIMGHEFAGIVVELGPDIRTVAIGDRVGVQNVLGCWRCAECERGLPNLCRERGTLGVHRDGGYAEFAVVPERNCTPLPDDMDFHLAAALQPFAVSTYAVEHAQLDPGDRIVVWGLGPIGLAVILASRLRGAETVLAFDRIPERLAVAGELGVPIFDISSGDPAEYLASTIGRHALDAVFEAAGAPETITPSLAALRKQKPMVLIGNLRDTVTADLMPLIMDQQRLIGTRSYSLAAWSLAVRTIAHSGYDRTLGDEVPLDAAIDRFDVAASGVGRPFTVMPNSSS